MTNKSKKISSEISGGELLDKISILEIKIEKITNKNNLNEVKKEHKILKATQVSSIKITDNINSLFNALKKINLILWNVEDKLRICEKNKDFGKNFIQLARDVYIHNDERAKIKSDINILLGSNIKEIKQYIDY
tara:strand:- start:163 stop:564 length:402 start_codon:yes stop_codon:yes gene_type:complete